MTTENTTGAAVSLPDGYDEPGGFWFVRPEHRAAYVAITEDDLRSASRMQFPRLREALAEHLRDRERERVRADMVREYMDRHGVDERKARQFLSNARGTIVLTPEEQRRIEQEYTPAIGFGWPDDAEKRVHHLYRRQTAAANVERARRAAEHAERNRCAMCGRIDPTMKLTTSYPLRGLLRNPGTSGLSSGPPVTCCDGCTDVIRNEAAELRAALLVEGSDTVTVRDRARELIAAYVPLLIDSDTAARGTLDAVLSRR